MRKWFATLSALACLAGGARAAEGLLFIHHSVGQNWLDNSLRDALAAKAYVAQVDEIYYGTAATADAGRPTSLPEPPGDYTDMCTWTLWFNDYFQAIRTNGRTSGFNQIVMFKSCFPNSNIEDDGSEPGDPFSDWRTLANYKAIYRHPSGPGNSYSHGGYSYLPLEDIFAAHPDILFIPVTAPPLCNGDTTDANGHRARLFDNWLKTEWLASYNTAHPGLNNVAVFDFFNVLANADSAAKNPNRLKKDYGGSTNDSHPNAAGSAAATVVFATGSGNFIDAAWASFPHNPTVTLTMAVSPAGSGSTSPAAGTSQAPTNTPFAIGATAAPGHAFDGWTSGGGASVADPAAANTTATLSAAGTITAKFRLTEWRPSVSSSPVSYLAGANFQLRFAFNYNGSEAFSTAGLTATLPDGWGDDLVDFSGVPGAPSSATFDPATNSVAIVWDAAAGSSDPGAAAAFPLTVSVPAGAAATASVSAQARRNLVGPVAATPSPLALTRRAHHSSDYSPADWRVDVFELLRAVTLFNNGLHYQPDPSTADGFAPAATPSSFDGAAHHSADYNPEDGQIDIFELLRVVTLFNRGLYYTIDPSGPDGYAPSPAPPAE